MAEGLKVIGDRFKAKREELNLSLKEVENATSIRTLYLQAIEEGRVHHFLSPVYSHGFIRQYANFLSLDIEKLLKENPDALKIPAEKQEFAYGIGTLESRGNPQGGIRWLPNLTWCAALAVIAIVAWYFGKLVGAF